jgi:hypothetical protein
MLAACSGVLPAAGAAATQRPPQQALRLGGPEQYLQLLVGGLRQAGVQGLGGFRLTGDVGRINGDLRRGGVYEGSVGPCRFGGRLWVVA